MRLQPGGVPEGVWVDVVDKAGANGVGDDVAGGVLQVLVLAQGMIVEGARPQRPVRLPCMARFRRHGLEPLDGTRQRLVAIQADQPVEMVGHQYPGEKGGRFVVGARWESATGGACEIEV